MTTEEKQINVDMLNLILRRADEISKDLKDHIRDEGMIFRSIDRELESLRINQALHAQRNGWVNGGIAAIVAIFVSWAGVMLGKD